MTPSRGRKPPPAAPRNTTLTKYAPRVPSDKATTAETIAPMHAHKRKRQAKRSASAPKLSLAVIMLAESRDMTYTVVRGSKVKAVSSERTLKRTLTRADAN